MAGQLDGQHAQGSSAALASSVLSGLVAAGGRRAAWSDRDRDRIPGTYFQTINVPSLGISFRGVIVFTPDGGVVGTSSMHPSDIALGTWTRHEAGQFLYTLIDFTSDQAGASTGYNTINVLAAVADDELTGSFTVLHTDPQGVTTTFAHGNLTGTRLAATAP